MKWHKSEPAREIRRQMTVIPAVERWEAGDQEFRAILGYVESSLRKILSQRNKTKQFTCGKSVLLE